MKLKEKINKEITEIQKAINEFWEKDNWIKIIIPANKKSQIEIKKLFQNLGKLNKKEYKNIKK